MKALTSVFLIILSIFFILISPWYLPEKADVIIIGAGAAGMRAAIESKVHTDRIILLEKMPYPGGNTNKATAGFNAVLDKDDIGRYMQDTREAGKFSGNMNLIRMLVEKSSEALSDLIAMGADLEDRGLLAGHSQSRTYRPSGGSPVGREISSVLYKTVQNKGIDIRMENRALSISLKNKKLEVLVKNRTGKEYKIVAASVIIASGGFGGSPELVTRYNSGLKGFHTTNSASATGDYLALTRNIPVHLIDLEEIQTHPTVEPEFSMLITEALRGNGGILINSQGQRFTNEMDFREQLSKSILKQKNRFAWLIFDQTVRESLKSSEYYIKNQLTKSGNTTKELAEHLSLTDEILSDTLNKWNNSVLIGEDKDFQRLDLKISLQTPPYFAIKVTPGIHYCMGGLAIDDKARVLDETGNPIEGLFAAGEATGGIHGKDRLGGNSLTDAMVFGKIAGYEAAFHALGQ